MAYLSKIEIATAISRAERDYESVALGGTLRARELTRLQWRAASEAARVDDAHLDVDTWHAYVFAAGVCDPSNGSEPLFSGEEVLAWPRRDGLWDDIAAVANVILKLSEVGSSALKSGDPAPDEG